MKKTNREDHNSFGTSCIVLLSIKLFFLFFRKMSATFFSTTKVKFIEVETSTIFFYKKIIRMSKM
jgi:hypothetical protein